MTNFEYIKKFMAEATEGAFIYRMAGDTCPPDMSNEACFLEPGRSSFGVCECFWKSWLEQEAKDKSGWCRWRHRPAGSPEPYPWLK